MLLRSSATSSGRPGQARSLFDMFSRSGGESVTSVLMAGRDIDYAGFMRKLRSGEVNFVWEVWAMRATCEEPSTPEQCDEAIITGIEKRLASPEKEQLAGLFRRYFQYEAKMREFELGPDRSFDAKYALIRKKRRELLGAEDSRLVFGMEESQVDFLGLARRQTESSKSLSGDERVRQYEALKRKTYGPYYEAAVGREDKFANYQNEMELRQGDFSGYTAEERNRRTLELQQRYFGKGAARAIREAHKAEQAEQQRLANYAEREKEYISANPNASDAEKQARLRQLRIDTLGVEEAAAYERRRQFEEAVSKIK